MPAMMPTARLRGWPLRPKYRELPNIVRLKQIISSNEKFMEMRYLEVSC
jgi:hypothetical protein